jgi:hypothetical protein
LPGLQESASVGHSEGIEAREMFCEYFNGPGALPWQNKGDNGHKLEKPTEYHITVTT